MTEPDKKIIHDWPTHEKKTIEAWCCKRICDFESADFNRLDAKLVMIQRFVGVKDFLSDPEMDMLIEYLTDEFPSYAIEEIEQAVRLAVANRLLSEAGKPLSEHYNEFGALYLTKILQAYASFRGKIVRKYQDGVLALIEADRLANQKPLTPEQNRQNLISFAMAAFLSYKEGHPTIGLDRIYDFLKEENRIDITGERWAQFSETAKEALKMEAKRGDSLAKSIMQAIAIDESTNGTLIAKTKTLAVKDHFRQLIDNNAHLGDYFIKP